MQSVVVTGVSSGIGYATAVALVERGYHLFGSVRNGDDAARLSAELGNNFTPLLFDVTDHDAIATAVEQVHICMGERNLAALINNAGISTPGPLRYQPVDDIRALFEVNLLGLLDVTQQFLPLLGAQRHAHHPPGRIINISSVSGRIAYPFMGAYAASKHALEALSDALRREMLIYGIEVIVIEPGTTRTPIKEKFARQVSRYANTDYGEPLDQLAAQIAVRERTGLPVARVVDVIVEALESQRPKTRYVVPRKWLTGWLIPRWLPDRWLDWLVARQLGLHRR